MRFFESAQTKTVLHGLSAWTIYKVFNFIDHLSGGDKSTRLENIILKNIIHSVCIPSIAVISVEDIIHKIYQKPLDIDLVIFNTLGAIASMLISPFSLADMESHDIVALTLYAFAFFHRYCGNIPFITLNEDEQPTQGYRI